ncbi:3'-5' exoribonuclease [compost metagenome]
MRLFLDSEFSQLSAQAKLISLALVGQDRREFYVELQDTWLVDDCSEFVKKIVLPQLWGGEYTMPIIEARRALLQFLATYDEQLEIVTDAPAYDWELFCELAYDDGKWPKNVRNFPTDATTLTATNDGEELPHHALLDARIIASMFTARA